MMKLIRRLSWAALFALVATPVAAQSGNYGLRVHGFLVQAAAASDSLQVMGIPTSGTTDYRKLAIQARYVFDDNSSMVVQFSHRRMGQSALNEFEPAVDLDWAFFRHRIGPLSLRVGRTPIPIGFYNEVRDVGTVLPFFRAPFVIYPDGIDGLDGVTAAWMLDIGNWSVDAQAFAGGIDLRGVSYTPVGHVRYDTRSDRTFGGAVTLGTPITGLRGAVSIASVDDKSIADRFNVWVLSGEIDRERWLLRAERLSTRYGTATELLGGYVHARVKIAGGLHALAQYERSDITLHQPVQLSYRSNDDRAVGLSYAMSPNVVLKTELHRAKGYSFDGFVNPFGPAARTNYGIASIAVSF